MSQPNQIMYFGDEDFSDFLKRIIREVLLEFLKDENSPYHSQGDRTLKVYTRKQAAKLLEMSPNSVTALILRKEIHASIFNRQYRISEKEIIKFLKQKQND